MPKRLETSATAAINSPLTLLNLLKKAKKAYQKEKPEPKEEAEVRHTKIVQGLTRLRRFAAKKDDAARKPFTKEKKSVLKLMKAHFKKLKADQKEDPNKAQLPKYLKKFTALMLAVQKLDFDSLKEDEEEANLEDLPDQELSAAQLDALAADDEETDEEGEADEEEVSAEQDEAEEEPESTTTPLLHPQEARWISDRRIIEERLLEALKERRGDVSQMRAIFAFAVEKAGAREFAPALQALDRLEKLLDAAREEGAAKEPGMDPMAPFMLRLKALMPQIQQAVAGGNPNGTEAKLRASEAGVFARKKDFEQANRLLDEAEELLSGEGEEEPDEFEELYRGLLETIPEDLQRLRTVNATAAATIQKIVTGARGKAEQGDFKAAFTFLDQATKGIARAMGAAAAEGGKEVLPGGKAVGGKGLKEWQSAAQRARYQVRRLQMAIRLIAHPISADVVDRLDGVIDELETDPASQAEAETLAAYLRTDGDVAAAEEPNPFGVDVKISKPLLAALERLRAELPA